MNFSAIMRKPGAWYAYLYGDQYLQKFIRQFMRISLFITILLLAATWMIQATPVRAQNISTEKVAIGLKHESLESAIRQMEQLTPFVFYYRRADIKPLTNLVLAYNNRTVDETLKALLENTFIVYRQIGKNVFIERSAQQDAYQVKGRALDANGKAIIAATVNARKEAGGPVVGSAQTDTGGYFKLDIAERGKYLVEVSLVGMNTLTVAVTLTDNQVVTLPDLVLSASTTQLQQVTIESKKAFIEQKIDRTVVNVDALIGNAGTTALDVLEKSPGVQVDQNGGISLKGKSGVTIFIDNKPVYLSGEELQNYLRALPSSTLDQIEIMTNPPAQYDAAGNGGVINFKTKKSVARGFNGGLSLALLQGRYAKTNNSFNFNYRAGKLNFFGNVGYGTQHGFNDLYIDRQYFNPNGSTNSFLNQHTYINQRGNSVSSKLGLDYYASDKTTFGIVLNGMDRNYTPDFNSTSNLLNAARTLDSAVIAHNVEHHNNKNGGINLNYRHEYDKNGGELTADLDYLVYQSNTMQQFNNFTYLANQTLATQDQLNGNLPATVHIYSAKTDYTHPFTNQLKLMVGVKSSITQTDNLADYATESNNISSPDYDLSNHFIYRENINAAYINLNKDFKRLAIQAGLRFENTVSNGHQLGNLQKPDSAFNRNYNSLFPTLYLTYKLDSLGNNQFGLKIGRRIDRPFYQDLNPFVTPIDKYTLYIGNPLLNPSYSTDFELSHTYKNKLTTTLSYGTSRNAVNETIQIVNGIYYDRPGNIGSSNYESISVDGTFDLNAWLNFHTYAEVTHLQDKSAFYNGTLNTQGTYVQVNPMFQFKISDTWNAQLDGSYRSKLTVAQFILGDRGQVNIGVSKKISASTSVKFALNDIFYSQVNSGIITNLVLTDASYRNRNDTRYGVLTFSYRFGKAISGERKHNANGAESEQNRVKQ